MYLQVVALPRWPVAGSQPQLPAVEWDRKVEEQ